MTHDARPSLSQASLFLFLPATRLDRLEKAVRAGADAVILDLEDAVGPDDKARARDALSGVDPDGATPILVRVNGAGTPWHDADLTALAGLDWPAGVVLPKAETPEACRQIRAASGKPVLALVETAAGLRGADALAAASDRLLFGSIDFAADLGIAHTRDALLHARFALVMAARGAGRPTPVDGVTTATDDAERVTRDSRHAVEMGFGGKLLIHPAQIAPARRGFAPTDAELDRARRILAATKGAGGALRLDGEMIDAPVIRRAEQVVARAEAGRAGRA